MREASTCHVCGTSTFRQASSRLGVPNQSCLVPTLFGSVRKSQSPHKLTTSVARDCTLRSAAGTFEVTSVAMPAEPAMNSRRVGMAKIRLDTPEVEQAESGDVKPIAIALQNTC